MKWLAIFLTIKKLDLEIFSNTQKQNQHHIIESAWDDAKKNIIKLRKVKQINYLSFFWRPTIYNSACISMFLFKDIVKYSYLKD